jgi:integrase
MVVPMSSALISVDRRAALASTLDAARTYVKKAKADRTRATYAEQWRIFARWCASNGFESLPASPAVIGLYVTTRARTGRKVSTIALGLAAVACKHREARLESPCGHDDVRELLAGVRRTHSVAPAQKAPLLAAQLRAIVEGLPETTIGLRDRALLLLGWSGAFRRSELVGIEVQDLAFVEEGLVVRLARSKTDQIGAGRDVPIPRGRSAGTCPVRAVERWLAVSGIDSGAVFRAVGRHGDVRGPMRARDVASVVKKRVEAVGLDPDRFAGHSLRAGLATSAAKAGKSAGAIARVTGHKSLQTVERYVRHATLFDDLPNDGLL